MKKYMNLSYLFFTYRESYVKYCILQGRALNCAHKICDKRVKKNFMVSSAALKIILS